MRIRFSIDRRYPRWRRRYLLISVAIAVAVAACEQHFAVLRFQRPVVFSSKIHSAVRAQTDGSDSGMRLSWNTIGRVDGEEWVGKDRWKRRAERQRENS
jgi:hypothetical protein